MVGGPSTMNERAGRVSARGAPDDRCANKGKTRFRGRVAYKHSGFAWDPGKR
ncbi:hypothetical protein BLA50215_01027 [Burkholderia lata]|uniref:Uncharacterized protein n=1 Tax=Burkholderia lata (strain ATCC 17760 / DSM 23089 / LMG 22485 / NCIMB 9086 / R18194 / 383) TaxID=482957 RepID=A0A6P2VAS3_BURL3|nr:hypothetical protein BLA15945_01393 [Burkholderia lata]VWB45973.1 hypothetical protein BLA15816_02102 [Burkholderia lata]VWC78033.1 hypothetical protein BLA50215_01027 [Burkholderia lata]